MIGVPSSRVPSFVSFSFYANKNLTTGDGGMLTGTPSLIENARAFCHHGIERENGWRRDPRRGMWQYDVTDAGFKYGMTDLAAAVGVVQLRRMPAFQARRRAIAERYHKAFAEVAADGLELPTEAAAVEHAWHLYVVRLPLARLRISRNQFIEELGDRNIGASVHFRPLTEHPHFKARGFLTADYPVCGAEWERTVSLPIHPGLTDDDVDDVAAAVIEVLRAFRA